MSRARRQLRHVGSAILAVLTALTLALTLGGTAVADDQPTPSPSGASPSSPEPDVPSKRRVDDARSDVVDKQRSVEQLQAALLAAKARLDAAITEAEFAAESYNGALWQLGEARKKVREARAAADQAAADVEQQRKAIITLVTESYQNGTELSTATALVSDEGPEGVMNRYGVVQSAGDSMQTAYERFRDALAAARAATVQATRARQQQAELARRAMQLRDEAARAAELAGVAANAIAAQRAKLVAELAKAQNISHELAKERQAALEREAARKAAAAAQAEAEAREVRLQAEARRAAREAARAKQQAENQPRTTTPGDSGGTTPPYRPPVAAPPIDPSPPSVSGSGVARAIAFAKAQIGKPYQWAAAGPSSFDCSGLTMRAWQAGGKQLPHYSVAQFQMGTRISVAAARAGDLYFWSNNGSPSGIHHVAIALGGGRFIEAARTGLPVRYNSIYSWFPDYAVRL